MSIGTPENVTENQAELKFLRHLRKLHHRLQGMEDHKNLKPYFSQAADRLNDRILYLIGDLDGGHDSNAGTKLGKIGFSSVDENQELPQLSKTENLSANKGETHDSKKGTLSYYSKVRAVNLS